MKRWFMVLVAMALALSLSAEGKPVPTDGEVKVALQSILVATAATMAGRDLTPPVEFPESFYTVDSTGTNYRLTMTEADVGRLREVVLNSPQPAVRQMGFFEALLSTTVRLVPEYPKLIEYLRPQGLGTKEVYLSGYVEAARLTTSYPFRYEGTGTLRVWGFRFRFPFEIKFSFFIPLEGPYTSVVVPLEVLANGYDYLHVAQALFPPPPDLPVAASPTT